MSRHTLAASLSFIPCLRKIKNHGADIISAPADKPWGTREMGVRTPEGHRLDDRRYWALETLRPAGCAWSRRFALIVQMLL
jgi:hypothetical protein